MSRGLWLVLAAILTCVGGCSPDRAGTAPANRLDGLASVDPNGYQTYSSYSSYNGYRRTRVPEFQFVTTRGIRCRIGPNYPDYDQGVRCWSRLADAQTTENFARVSAYPYDTETNSIVSTPVPPDRERYSFVSHVDDLAAYETYLDEGLARHTVDPASYHVLARGQMISVAGSFGTVDATSTCAVASDDTVICEIRPADDGKTYGFELSPTGGRTF